MEKHLKGIRIFLLVFFMAGAVGLSLRPTRELFTTLVPYSLLTSYVILIIFHRADKSIPTLLFLLFIALAGFFLEVAGVYTGHIFGEYEYGNVLGLKVLGVPLLIGTNWLMLTYASHLIIRGIKIGLLLKLAFGALLMTTYDWLMEPAAIELGMWSWAGDSIPMQNYLAWFVLSFLFLGLLQLVKARYENPIARDIFVIQAGFFAAYQILANLFT